jgi:hypothetical protein
MEKARVLQVVCDFNETAESTRQHGTPHEKRLERLKGCRPMTCSLLPGATAGFARLVERAGEPAGLGFKALILTC